MSVPLPVRGPEVRLRCRTQVKRAGSKFCSTAHAAQARTTTRVTAPGARAHFTQTRQKDIDALTQALVDAADDVGRVPVTTAVSLAATLADKRYDIGYRAAAEKTRSYARKLRLTLAADAVNMFLGSRFGNAFVSGELSPEDLAKFSFGGRQRWPRPKC